jgi:hypothetical protein
VAVRALLQDDEFQVDVFGLQGEGRTRLIRRAACALSITENAATRLRGRELYAMQVPPRSGLLILGVRSQEQTQRPTTTTEVADAHGSGQKRP